MVTRLSMWKLELCILGTRLSQAEIVMAQFALRSMNPVHPIYEKRKLASSVLSRAKATAEDTIDACLARIDAQHADWQAQWSESMDYWAEQDLLSQSSSSQGPTRDTREP